MTKVIYEPSEMRMSISGHAGYAPAGQDIVCSAVSILSMALENMVIDHAESMQPKIHRKNGERKISCSPTKGNTRRCTTIFDTIYGGFELLAMNYPDHVQVIKVKGE